GPCRLPRRLRSDGSRAGGIPMTQESPGQGHVDSERDEALAQLLLLAGRRPAVPAERTARVRAAAHSAWREAAGARLQRRRFVRLAVAAAVVLAILGGLWIRRATVGARPVSATVAVVNGPAWIPGPPSPEAAPS